MPRRKPHCYPQRPRTLHGGGFARRADRQRGNRHQMIRTEAVEKPENERGGDQEHTKFYCIVDGFSLITQDTGTSFGR